jgi:hypothetical protein
MSANAARVLTIRFSNFITLDGFYITVSGSSGGILTKVLHGNGENPG